MRSFINEVLTDEENNFSSKRIAGLICIVALVFSLIVNTFASEHFKPAEYIINALAIVALGSLALTSIDKYSKSNKPIKRRVL